MGMAMVTNSVSSTPAWRSTEKTGKWGVDLRSMSCSQGWKEGLGRVSGWEDGAGNSLSVNLFGCFWSEVLNYVLEKQGPSMGSSSHEQGAGYSEDWFQHHNEYLWSWLSFNSWLMRVQNSQHCPALSLKACRWKCTRSRAACMDNPQSRHVENTHVCQS